MKNIRLTTKTALKNLDAELADERRKIVLEFPDSDWKHRHCWTESALKEYRADGLSICHAYFPCAGISAFVTYPAHQQLPTREQIAQTLRIALISEKEKA